jgi:hypothetical protein
MANSTATTTEQASGSPTSTATATGAITDPLAVPSVAEFITGYRASDKDFDKDIPLKDGFDPRPWQFRFFRFDEIENESAKIARDGFVKVTRNGSIYGNKFSEMFEKDGFDKTTGSVIGSKLYDKTSKEWFLETELFCRSINAYKAIQKVEADEGRNRIKKVQSKPRERDGVKTDEWVLGEESESLWD